MGKLAVWVAVATLFGAAGCGDDGRPAGAPGRDAGTTPADVGPPGPGEDASPGDAGPSDAAVPDSGPGADGGAPADAGGALSPWSAAIERCGDATDEDGDGLVNEDCPPSLWAGLYFPDLHDSAFVDLVEALLERRLSVIQTYRSTSALGAERLAADLDVVWARGSVAHVNLEPSGYAPAQYRAAATDPALGADLELVAAALAGALERTPGGRVLLTFGAEMNGDWVDWGCLPVGQYVALYRRAHETITAALDAAAIDRRRVRWAYGPNSTSAAGCASASEYFPGFDVVDYVGMSAYRSGATSAPDAATRPLKALSRELGVEPEWRLDRLLVLQTGTRQLGGDDGNAWVRTLFSTALGDPEFLGVVYFDDADWALLQPGAGPLDGWEGLQDGVRAAPLASPGLDGTFEPFFWDVGRGHPRYAEIQSLRAAGHTFGCGTEPPVFCPGDPLTDSQGAALLARAFHLAESDTMPVLCGGACTDAPVAPSALAAALATLAGTSVPALVRAGHVDGCREDGGCDPGPLTRADGAAWIVRTAGVAPAPPL